MHRLFIALILFNLACISHAAEVNNLYEAQGPVASRDDTDRANLSPQLLRQVLLKVVGNESLLTAVDIEPILSNAESFIQQFEYELISLPDADLTRPDELALKLRFDPTSVNQAIRQLQLPIWGKTRPDILIWSVVEQGDSQTLIGLESAPQDILKPLSDAAESRGLPLLMPLLDLQDQSALTAADVWNDSQSVIDAASTRYQPDIVLTAKMTFADDNSSIAWHVTSEGVDERWQSSGSLDEALKQGFGHLADKLSLRYTQLLDSNSQGQQMHLQISNVLSYADFTRLMSYLEQLELITDVRVRNLSNTELDLDIIFQGSEAVLRRMLSVGSLLVEQDSVASTDASHYRFIP